LLLISSLSDADLLVRGLLVDASGHLLLIWDAWSVPGHDVAVGLAAASGWRLHHMTQVLLTVFFNFSEICGWRIVGNRVDAWSLLGTIFVDAYNLFWLSRNFNLIFSCLATATILGATVRHSSRFVLVKVVAWIVFQKLFYSFLLVLILLFWIRRIFVICSLYQICISTFDLGCQNRWNMLLALVVPTTILRLLYGISPRFKFPAWADFQKVGSTLQNAIL
jgi:hypothetical protein